MESQPRHESTTPAPESLTINVGSRESKLALVQTNLVISKLEQFYSNNLDRMQSLLNKKYDSKLEFKVVAMTTTGDQVLNKPLSAIGSKSLFTKELEVELLEGRVDFVVHSLKDLPTTLPEGCVIGAVMKRDCPDDALVLKKSLRQATNPLEFLLKRGTDTSTKLKVGTSSQRRIAMIKKLNPDLDCIDIRGNLNTRISKLDNDESEYAAIILAMAGLERMGWSERASSLLSPESDESLADWCYAVGQGAIAIECRSNDQFTLDLLRPIVDLKTTYEAIAERSLMKKLEGGCSVPLGVRSTWNTGAELNVLKLDSIVLSLDGRSVVKASAKAQLSKLEDGETDSSDLEVRTTGVALSKTLLSSPKIGRNMKECSDLGIEVANKMIALGCIELMSRTK